MKTISLSDLILVTGGNSSRQANMQACKSDIQNGMSMGAVVGATMYKGNPVAAGIGALVGGAVAAKNSNSCQTFTSKDKSGNNYGDQCGNNYGG